MNFPNYQDDAPLRAMSKKAQRTTAAILLGSILAIFAVAGLELAKMVGG